MQDRDGYLHGIPAQYHDLDLEQGQGLSRGLEMIHNRYRPYKNNKTFLMGAPSPPNDPLLGEGDEEHACRGVLSGGVFLVWTLSALAECFGVLSVGLRMHHVLRHFSECSYGWSSDLSAGLRMQDMRGVLSGWKVKHY